MRILRILLQVTYLVQALLVAQLDAAQIEDTVLHRDSHLLAGACFVAANQRSENADRQVHAGIGVAKGGCTHRWRTIPEARGGRGPPGALRHVFVDFQVLIVMAITETFYRGYDHAWIEFTDVIPGEAHAVKSARAKIFNQYIGFLDQLFQHFLALRLLGVQRERLFIAVKHSEIQGIYTWNVTQLGPGDVP